MSTNLAARILKRAAVVSDVLTGRKGGPVPAVAAAGDGGPDHCRRSAAARRRSYRRLLGYARPHWRGWVLIVAATLFTGACGLLQPWPMQVVVDHVLGDVPLSPPAARALGLLPGAGTGPGLLAWMVAAGLVVFACGSAADVVLTRAWIRVGQRMVYDLAGDLFAHLQRRSLVFHSRHPVGDSLSRITEDSWCVYRVVEALLFTPPLTLLVGAAMVAVMVRMDLTLTLVAVAVVPFLTGVSLTLGPRIRAAARARREVESRLRAHVQQTLTGIPVVQAFAQEEREHERFRRFTAAAVRAQRRSTLAGSLFSLATGLIATLGTAVILWLGGRRVLSGELTLGSLLVFLAYLRQLQGQRKAFSDVYVTLQQVGANVDRVAELLEAEPEVRDRPGAALMPAVEGHLRLERVTFGYEPGRPVLHDVSLEVRPGQTVAIVGATGAGKTTLAGLVARLFDPWQGRVLIDGRDVRDVRLKSLRGQVGLVLQESFLFPFSIAANIAYGRPAATDDDIEVAARAANIHEFIEGLPDGYRTVLGERGSTLSGGQRQRLSIARALLKNAPVLILDEPTSALDADTERLLLDALVRLMRGRTTLIIAHRFSTIRHADRVVVLHEGRVVETGTHDELLARDGRYARLYRAQGQAKAKVG